MLQTYFQTYQYAVPPVSRVAFAFHSYLDRNAGESGEAAQLACILNSE